MAMAAWPAIEGVTLDHSYDSIDRIEAAHRERLRADAEFAAVVESYLGETLIANVGAAAAWDFSSELQTAGQQVVFVTGVEKPFEPQVAVIQLRGQSTKRPGKPGVLRDETVRWDRKDREAALASFLKVPAEEIDLAGAYPIEGLDAAGYRSLVARLARGIGAAYVARVPTATWTIGDVSNSDAFGRLVLGDWQLFGAIQWGLSRGKLQSIIEEQFAKVTKTTTTVDLGRGRAHPAAGAGFRSHGASSTEIAGAVTPFERVLAEPGSIAARRALAAAGDPHEELIEKQLELRDLQRAGSGSAKLQREIAAIIARDGKTLAGPIAGLVSTYTFYRGMIAEVTLSGEQWVAGAATLLATAPIQHVQLVAPLGDLGAFLARPELLRLRTLLMPGFGASFGDAGAIQFAAAPTVANLRRIDLARDAIGRPGVEALAASPYLERAARINFAGNPANPTPHADDLNQYYARPNLADELEQQFGRRPWLDVPDAEPIHWDEQGVTP
ncbi:MAG: hypothetical protein K8W52_40690 [Deltaproteobacteria bacterium]|nr:hypothetical protein [Deltaproteobacteria bacterium]